MSEIIKRFTRGEITLLVDINRMVVLENLENNPFIHSEMTKEQRKKYFEFRREFCPYSVNLHYTPEVKTLMKDEVFSFIIDELSGKWFRTKGIVFCFELEEDAMAFKLRWL